MSKLFKTCTRCGGTGRFIGANGHDQGPCWRCSGELAYGAPAQVAQVAQVAPAFVHRYYGARFLPMLGAFAGLAFMATVVGHMWRAPAAMPTAQAVDYGMIAAAVWAARPADKVAPAVAPAQVAPVKVAPRKVAPRPAARVAQVVYFVARPLSGCTCGL